MAMKQYYLRQSSTMSVLLGSNDSPNITPSLSLTLLAPESGTNSPMDKPRPCVKLHTCPSHVLNKIGLKLLTWLLLIHGHEFNFLSLFKKNICCKTPTCQPYKYANTAIKHGHFSQLMVSKSDLDLDTDTDWTRSERAREKFGTWLSLDVTNMGCFQNMKWVRPLNK